MIHRYFSLSGSAALDENRLIWIVDKNWIKIPDGQLTLLFNFYSTIDKISGSFLNDIFGTLESNYIELDEED